MTMRFNTICLLLLLPICLSAQKNYAPLLAQFMNGQHDHFKFNGNVLVARGGKPIYQQSFGYADFNSKTMLNDSSAFELASVSKQFTAMGIMILKERGLLRYEDDIKKFFPALPYEHITIRNLLTHTSGLPSYEDQFEKKWDRKKIAYNKDILEMLIREKDSLFFKPGSNWQYSNTGYALLASIIEKVSGMSYNDFMAKSIFSPLGMTRTFILNGRRASRKTPDNYALGFVYSDSLHRYILPDSLPKLDMVYYLDGIVGDGCVNSTTGDLLKWINAWNTEKLVSKPAINEMLSPLVRISPDDSSGYYGFGVRIQLEKGHRIITHGGGWPGYSTLVAKFVDKDQIIIILSNNETSASLINAGLASILSD